MSWLAHFVMRDMKLLNIKMLKCIWHNALTKTNVMYQCHSQKVEQSETKTHSIYRLYKRLSSSKIVPIIPVQYYLALLDGTGSSTVSFSSTICPYKVIFLDNPNKF